MSPPHSVQQSNKVPHYLLVVLSAALATAFVVDHHATELALVFAGLLPHDGAAGGGGAAGHGCCKWRNEEETRRTRDKEKNST